MTRREKREYWRRLVEKRRQSGLSAAAFCRQQQINQDQFYRWRRRLARGLSGHDTSTPGNFLELICHRSSHPHSGIRLCLGSGLYIEVERGFDRPTLRALLDTFQSF